MGLSQPLEKGFKINESAKSRLASWTTVHDMVDRTRIFNTQGPSHPSRISPADITINKRFAPYAHSQIINSNLLNITLDYSIAARSGPAELWPSRTHHARPLACKFLTRALPKKKFRSQANVGVPTVVDADQ